MPTANINGYELFYALDDFADPWTPHDTILMQHHVVGNHNSFRPWVPILAAEYCVIRMDRRGNGRSSKPPLDYQYRVEDLLSDFREFLKELWLEKVHYVGDSLGGVLGIALAATHPELVKSLVLCATPCLINAETQRRLALEGHPDALTAVTAMGSRAYAYSRWLREVPPDAPIADLIHAVYLAEQTAMLPTHVLASLVRMVSQPDFDVTSMLPNIKAPTLLLSPGASASTSMEEQSMMKERIPNCEQVVFEGARHMISMDAPQRCSEEMLKFIRRHS